MLVGPLRGAKSCRFCGGAWSLEQYVRLLCPCAAGASSCLLGVLPGFVHVSGQAACYGQLVSLPAANFLTASQTVIAGLVSWAAVSVVLLCSFIVGCAHSSSLQCSLVGIRPIPIPMYIVNSHTYLSGYLSSEGINPSVDTQPSVNTLRQQKTHMLGVFYSTSAIDLSKTHGDIGDLFIFDKHSITFGYFF